MARDDENGLFELLKGLENPVEEVRLECLARLQNFPSLTILKALKRVAVADASPSVRYEARKLLGAMQASISRRDVPVAGKEEGELRFKSLLKNPDPTVRTRVVKQLAMSQEPKVPALLASALRREKEPWVICAMLQGLAATGGKKAARYLIFFLTHKDPRVRATAIESLEVSGEKRALPQIMPFLKDKHHRVRAAAARVLRAHDWQEVSSAVDRMLASSEDMMIRSALFVVRYFKEQPALDRLESVFSRTPPPPQKQMAMIFSSMRFLAKRRSVKAAQFLARHRQLDVKDTAEGLETRGTLVEVDTAPLIRPIEETLTAPDPMTRIHGIREMLRLGRADLLPDLKQILERETDEKVLSSLVGAIGRLGEPEDVERLKPYLRHPDPRLRANTVEALGLLGAGRVDHYLMPMLDDPNNRVRANAIVSLQASARVEVIPHLMTMAQHTDPIFVKSAIWAASTMASPEAVSVIEFVLHSGEPELQAAARRAMEAFGPMAEDSKPAASSAPVSVPAPMFDEVTEVALPDEEVQRLLFDLQHDSPRVRLKTVRKIAAIKDKRLIEPVRRLLQEDDPAVRHSARQAVRALLQQISTVHVDQVALDAFQAGLKAGGAKAKETLGAALDLSIKSGPRPLATILMQALPVEEDPYLRAGMLSVLGFMGDPADAKLILAFTEDPDSRVRANALDALDLLGNADDLRGAVICLGDSDPRVRAAAITAAVSIYKEPFLSHLRDMLHSESVAERAAGLYALNAVFFDERFELLKDYFAAEAQPRLYESAGESLAREMVAEHPDEIPGYLLKIHQEDKRRHLESCVRRCTSADETGMSIRSPGASSETTSRLQELMDQKAAAKLTGKQVRDLLRKESDPLTVIFLLETAGEMRLEDAVELAQPYTHSKDRRVRLASAEALGRLEGAEAIECLASMAQDRDDPVATTALDQLRKKDPDLAYRAVIDSLRSGTPWGVRRALEYLEEHPKRELMLNVLDLVEKGNQPAAIEPITRLVVAMGERKTLDDLARLYARVSPSGRPFVLELARVLGEKVGIERAELDKLFPAKIPRGERLAVGAGPASGVNNPLASTMDLARKIMDPLATFSGTLPQKGGPDTRPMVEIPRISIDTAHLNHPAFPVLIVLAAVVGIFWVFWPAQRNRDYDISADPSARESAPATKVEFSTNQPKNTDLPHADFSSRFDTFEAWEPTLEEIESSIARAFASKGLTSKTVIRIMALDRAFPAYRRAIGRARVMADEGQYARAIEVLEAAFEETDPGHFLARMALARAMMALSREGLLQNIPRAREIFAQVRGEMLKALADAAARGELPGEDIEKLTKGLEEKQKAELAVEHASDWLSGSAVAGDDSDPNKPAEWEHPPPKGGKMIE